LLSFSEQRIVNLILIPTNDATDLTHASLDPEVLMAARPTIAEAISTSGVLLFGWGKLSSFGPNRGRIQEQIDWVVGVAIDNGHKHAWAVGDARHPSRWHQYVADKHGRTEGGDADARLRAVLARRGLSTFSSLG